MNPPPKPLRVLIGCVPTFCVPSALSRWPGRPTGQPANRTREAAPVVGFEDSQQRPRARPTRVAEAAAAASTVTQPDPVRSRGQASALGWYVHVCVDDYSRLAYAEVLADERTTTAIGFLERAVAFYRRRGIRVERLLTDN